jgi:hypothetical protein
MNLDDEAHFHVDHADGILRLCEHKLCVRSDMAYWVLPAVGSVGARLREDLAIAEQVRSDCEVFGNSFYARDEDGRIGRIEPSEITLVVRRSMTPDQERIRAALDAHVGPMSREEYDRLMGF